MTEKRFYVAESNLIDGYCVFDREKKYAFHPRPRKADCLNDAHTLNELNDENEQLKERLKLVRKDLTHIMLLLLDDKIVKQLSDYDIKVFERLSKV